jgi:hypothetical protein
VFNEIQARNCSDLCPYSSTFTNDKLHFDLSHIRHFPNFVCPQNFRNLADWIYGWPDQFLEHVEVTTDQAKRIAPCLPSGSIIYVRIWVIEEFFEKVYPYLQNDFVLITGEGDMSSPTHLEILEASDSKIIHWFGQNGQYDVSKSKKFTHLPIGNFFFISLSCSNNTIDSSSKKHIFLLKFQVLTAMKWPTLFKVYILNTQIIDYLPYSMIQMNSQVTFNH